MFPLLYEINLGFIHIPLHTYGFMIAIGFLLGIATVRKLSAKSGMNPDVNADLAFWLLMYGFLGARILFVITRFDYFLANPMDIIKVWEGGLVFFGGLIAATAYAFYYFRKHRLNIWRMLDVLSPGLVIAHAFGRIGCLSAGCCYGKPTDVPWAIKLNSDLVDDSLKNVPLHPTQIYEALALFILYFGLLHIFRTKKFDGQVGLTYFMLYPIIRSLIEIFRGDTIRGFVIDGILSTSQFISILVFIGASMMLIIRLKQAEKNVSRI
ncbi:MAG: prolipoprotein diacylglyceryl transferase [Bdellovibrionales bacterium]|nr:prolipoprotein diacylglyceryl transferase [Oligoflexia bacterium]